MPRARNIKPGFFKNDQLAETSAHCRLLFIGLWTLADRDGRLEYRPRRVKGELFPYESIDVDDEVCHLESLNFVKRYEVSGVQYIQILNFKKHQKPHPNERSENCPSPEDATSDREMVRNDREKELSTRADRGMMNDDRGMMNVEDAPSDKSHDAELPAENPDDPIVEQIPLNDGTEHPVRQSEVNEYQRLYPAVDVHQALRNIRGWALGNPSKRKTRRGIKKHITNWLASDQDKGSKPGGQNGPINKGHNGQRAKSATERFWERREGRVFDNG